MRRCPPRWRARLRRARPRRARRQARPTLLTPPARRSGHRRAHRWAALPAPARDAPAGHDARREQRVRRVARHRLARVGRAARGHPFTQQDRPRKDRPEKGPLMRRLLLALLLTASACLFAAPASAASPTTITLVTHDSFAISKSVLADFKKETGITVKILQSGDAGAALNQVVLTKSNPIGDA